MRHCLRVRSRWPDFGQTFSCAFMDLESRHSQAGTTDPLFTPVANQNPTVNLPCPIDAFHRRPGHVKGCPSLPKLQINQKIIVNHASGNHTRMVMQSVLHPHQPNCLREVRLQSLFTKIYLLPDPCPVLKYGGSVYSLFSDPNKATPLDHVSWVSGFFFRYYRKNPPSLQIIWNNNPFLIFD